jgi:signal peptidase II
MSRTKRSLMILLVAAASAALLDQATKWLIVEFVMQPPRKIEVTSFLNVVLGFNRGVSFGMFGDSMADRQNVLIVFNSLIVAALLAWAWRTELEGERIGFGLVSGGAIGNILDRWRQGGVTDFIDFHWNGWHWPAFNVADIAITSGVAVVFAATLFGSREPARSDGGT